MKNINEKSEYTPCKEKERGYLPRVVVKFRDYIELPYKDGVEDEIQERKIGLWDQLVREFPGITLKRLYTSVDPEKIQEIVDRAREIDEKYEPPNLMTYFVIDCPLDVNPERLAQTLSEWNSVQTAYVEAGPTPPPQLVNYTDDPRFTNQCYIHSSPDGIDAQFGWDSGGTGILGADGAGIQFIDIEQGWMLNHEDLNAAGITLISGVNNMWRSHGTSVLGEVVAVDNNLGGVGIAPAASARVVSQWRTSTVYNTSDAIMSAIANLNFGDVLLLEAQTTLPGSTYLPVEVEQAVFDTIRLGTALGMVIVEAAGNGSNDLDTFTDAVGDQVLNRGSTDFRDSGAIMVAAASSTSPHTRVAASNFGSRIDCYAWGENVDTCSCNNAGTVSSYTSTFKNTSAASPIIAGAALVVQGMAEDNLTYRFSPFQIRVILSDPANGTLSNNPATDRIGVMPDLQTIIQNNVLNLAPDVYIRDFVGDTGDPHVGAISASPDIILRKTKVSNPQASYGETSGTENNNMLGYEAEAGKENYIYVRVRNRGGSAAANVVATVFWSPVSSLLTPDLWTLVDSVTIPNVPTGDLLTVSDAITWPASSIPGTGHYCFVGLVGNEDDPAPDPAAFLDWDNFRRFIRENNNVTWRNFNVVPNVPSPPEGYPPEFVVLPFLAPGAPDKARPMQLEVVARLPRGARVLVEMPLYLVDALHVRSPLLRIDQRRGVAWIPVNPHGKSALGEGLFPAKSRSKLKILVHIPEKLRKMEYEVFVRQIFEKEEVGRVTWRLVPPERIKKLAELQREKE